MTYLIVFGLGVVFGAWCARCIIKGDGCGYYTLDECDR